MFFSPQRHCSIDLDAVLLHVCHLNIGKFKFEGNIYETSVVKLGEP